MKRVVISFLTISLCCARLISFTSCAKHDNNDEITFNVTIDEISSFSSKITITHNGTNRDLYYGQLYEGNDINAKEIINELLDLYLDGQLPGELLSQRKRVVTLTGLSPEKTYTYLVFGIDNEGNLNGIPDQQTFTTLASNFTAIENPNWVVSYLGQALYNNGYYSKFTVNVVGEIEERYFLATYPISIHDQFETKEEFIAYAIEQFNQNNIENNPDFWLESDNIAAGNCTFYQYHNEGDYISYAIGLNANGTPTGHYSKSETFHIDKYPMTPGYANLLGNWIISDKEGKIFNVTFYEHIINQSAKMIGWGEDNDTIEILYSQNSMSIYIKDQLSMDETFYIIDGELVWGSLYLKGWYINQSGETKQVKNINYICKGSKTGGNQYTFEPMFTITFPDGTTAQTTGLAYEFHPEGVSYYYRFAKMTFPLTMTKQ